jgi:hypothetical protein
MQFRLSNTAGSQGTTMTLTGTGNVGIGTPSPSEIFHVNKNNAGNIVGGYFTNSQANTGAESVSLAFGLNRSGGDFVRQIKAITFGAEQQWTGTESTVDGYLSFSTVQNESVSERMRITSSGNVGIGTESPATAKLQINSSNNAAAPSLGAGSGVLFISSVNGLYGLYSGTTSDGYSWLQSTRNDGAATAYAIAMQPNGGNVLIGTTTDAGYKLDVNGTGRFSGSGDLLRLQGGSSNAAYLSIYENSTRLHYIGRGTGANYDLYIANNQNANILLQTNDITRLSIASTGEATFSSSVTSTGFFVSSDITLKTLTQDKFDASKIDAITYKWKTDLQGKTLVGYSAQDVQKYMPDAVNTDSNGKLSVDYIQVLVQKIAHLETELKSLKNGLE